MTDLTERLQGVLVGTAVGDSLGLPAEGMSKRRIARRWRGEWRQRFVFGQGMISDDTEHTLFVAQSLLNHPSEIDGFTRSLAWRLRGWLLGLPAGVGFGTLRAVLKLWLGWSPERSGVRSAGNGPAMRSAIIGAYFHDDPGRREAFVRASTIMTHTDPRALVGSRAVAEVAAWEMVEGHRPDPAIDGLLATLRGLDNGEEWTGHVDRMVQGLESQRDIYEFAALMGVNRGVRGYIYETVVVAIYSWLRYRGEYDTAVRLALNLGGDTDTVGAIVGAMAGASVGVRDIPTRWRKHVVDWPRSVGLLERVGARLAEQKDTGRRQGAANYFWPAVLPRNVVFLVIVLIHGVRRVIGM